MLTTYFYLKTITTSLAIGAAAVIIYFIATANVKKQNAERVTDSGIYDIDQMDKSQFELFLLHLFKGYGYVVEVRQGNSSQGTELLISKDNEQSVVIAANDQRHMGVHSVERVIEAKSRNSVSSAWLVTNRDFTSAAYTLASTKRVQLINRESLIDMVIALKVNQQSGAASKAMSEHNK